MRRMPGTPEVERLVNDLPVPTALVDTSSRIVHLNPLAADRFGDVRGRSSSVLGEGWPHAPWRDGEGNVLGTIIVCARDVSRRWPPTPDLWDGPFDARYDATAESVPEARRAVAAWFESHHVDGPRVPDVLLALTELTTNAVSVARGAIEVRAWLTDDAVNIEVTDDGPGFAGAPPEEREIDPMATRGRGLFLVARLVDECTIVSSVRGTIVRCLVAR